jgi:hypothetical protein
MTGFWLGYLKSWDDWLLVGILQLVRWLASGWDTSIREMTGFWSGYFSSWDDWLLVGIPHFVRRLASGRDTSAREMTGFWSGCEAAHDCCLWDQSFRFHAARIAAWYVDRLRDLSSRCYDSFPVTRHRKRDCSSHIRVLLVLRILSCLLHISFLCARTSLPYYHVSQRFYHIWMHPWRSLGVVIVMAGRTRTPWVSGLNRIRHALIISR